MHAVCPVTCTSCTRCFLLAPCTAAARSTADCTHAVCTQHHHAPPAKLSQAHTVFVSAHLGSLFSTQSRTCCASNDTRSLQHSLHKLMKVLPPCPAAVTILQVCAPCWPLVILEVVSACGVNLDQDLADAFTHAHGCCSFVGIALGLVWQFCSQQVVAGTGFCWLVLVIAALLPTRQYEPAPCSLCTAVQLHGHSIRV